VVVIAVIIVINLGQKTIIGQTISDCNLPTVWSILTQRSKYFDRLNNINIYNNNNLWKKKGISICPVKYGIGWSGYNAGLVKIIILIMIIIIVSEIVVII
jgi:xanthine dehydrogenase molybdopterin-binding subunit B